MTFTRNLAALTALAAGFVLSSCGLGQDILLNAGPPVIAYASPVSYTVGVAAFHGVQSTGGPVTSFTVSPSLPAGLSLDASTGALGGVAENAANAAEYTVIAEGPGSRDTAFVTLGAVAMPVDPAVARPEITYTSPVTDTAGRLAAHAVISTGGPVTGYSTPYNLPAGLKLDAATGRITGTPTGPSAAFAYTVIAFGPGGRDTATIVLTVVANPKVARPQIAYASPVTDTVGRPASHAVISTGGPVTRYELYTSDALDLSPVVMLSKPQDVIWPGPNPYTLPAGLSLNTTTGRISGTPTEAKGGATYTIIASGPGGHDTAMINLGVWEPTVTPGPPVVLTGVSLALQLQGGQSVLAKGAALRLDRLIVTLTSSISADAPIRDTIRAGTRGFTSNTASGQILNLNYNVKALRSWTVNVQVLDVNGVVVHTGSAVATNLVPGESRSLALSLPLRFAPYRASLSLPDSLRLNVVGMNQSRWKVNIKRIVLVVAGDTVRDTTAPGAGYFAPTPAAHILEYDYLNPGFSHAMAIYVYGSTLYVAPGTHLLYGATFNYVANGMPHSPVLNWMGPEPIMGGPVFAP